jgi:1,4-dihydroxy-2-naphthoate octaprenyltransferase
MGPGASCWLHQAGRRISRTPGGRGRLGKAVFFFFILIHFLLVCVWWDHDVTKAWLGGVAFLVAAVCCGHFVRLNPQFLV